MIIPMGLTFNIALKNCNDYEKLAYKAVCRNDIKNSKEFFKIANYYKQIAEKLKEREYNKKLKIY